VSAWHGYFRHNQDTSVTRLITQYKIVSSIMYSKHYVKLPSVAPVGYKNDLPMSSFLSLGTWSLSDLIRLIHMIDLKLKNTELEKQC